MSPPAQMPQLSIEEDRKFFRARYGRHKPHIAMHEGVFFCMQTRGPIGLGCTIREALTEWDKAEQARCIPWVRKTLTTLIPKEYSHVR